MVAGRSFYLPSSSSFATSSSKDDLVARLPRPLLLVVRPELLPPPRLPAKISRGASSSGHLLLPPATSRCCSHRLQLQAGAVPRDARTSGTPDTAGEWWRPSGTPDTAGEWWRTSGTPGTAGGRRTLGTPETAGERWRMLGTPGTAGGQRTSGLPETAGERWWMPGTPGTAGGRQTSGTPETAGERWTAGRWRIATDKI